MADTSGAEAVEASIFKIEDAAKQAERELDVLEATARRGKDSKKGGILGTDITAILTGAADKAGFGDEVRAITDISGMTAGAVSADAAVIGGSFAAIGLAGAKAYQTLSEAVAGYKQLFTDAKASGIDLGDDLESQVAVLESSLQPISGVIDTIQEKMRGLWAIIQDPAGELSGLNALANSLRAQQEAAEKLKTTRIEIAGENQKGISEIYGVELQKLEEQERTIKRIATLRNELGTLSVQAARQEVEDARMRGGDVALAEANALATTLQSDLTKLGDNVRSAQAEANTATTGYNTALNLYKQGMADELNKLKPEEFLRLSANVDRARAAMDNANQAIVDQEQVYTTAKNNLLRGTEIELNKLEQQYNGQISSVAARAFDGVYQTLQTEVVKGPADAVSRIQASTQPITDTATAKAGEVKGQIDQAAATVSDRGNQMVDGLGQFREALEKKDDRVLAAFGSLTNSVDGFISRFSEMENRVQRIESHISQ
ncbi:MAG: hypothetical protein EON58_11420 [Alphaproteobacteria bacterium]|nr:MAG: hypothetical protein EON58_11420 [Alphaproteobacteria bacterium]